MKTVPHQLRARAHARPHDVATEVVGGGRLTFGAWEERSNAVARGLIERGVSKGDRVLLPCDTPDWLEYAIAHAATHKAGAIAVPVCTRLGPSHGEWAARASRAVGVVGERAAEIDAPVWAATIGELEAGRSTEPLEPAVTPDDPADILYTSGTTGLAKGVVATHRSLLFLHPVEPSTDELRVVLHSLPPGTTVGQGLLVQPLSPVRSCVVTLAAFDDRAFLAAVEEYRPVELVLVPALALSLIRADRRHEYDVSSVKVVRSTSAAIPATALEQLDAMFPNADVINLYSSTEAWPAHVRIRFDPRRPSSVGLPRGGSAVRVVDREGREVEPGVSGDVQLRLAGAPQRRYDADAEASAGVFLDEGWVRTGDIGYVDEDGYLYLVDRNADLVNVGGLNVSTLEAEAALHEFPGVREAAAFGVPHPVLGEFLAAAIRIDDDLDVEALRAFAESRLGAKAPKRIVAVEEFPRNAVGKVLKRQLPELLADQLQPSGPTTAPRSEIERLVATLWEEALGVEGVGLEDDFLVLGGTSLSAMEITARLREGLGRQISQRDLFETNTLAEFALRVEAAPPALADAEPPIPRAARAAG